MAASYLFNALKPLYQIIHMKDYVGKRIAVDASAWFFQCALAIAVDTDITIFIDAFFSLIDILIGSGVIPVVIFGGKVVVFNPKAEKQHQRIPNQENSKNAFCAKRDETTGHLQESIRITHVMMDQILKQLDARNIDHVVSPYEVAARTCFLMPPEIGDAALTCNGISFVVERDIEATLEGWNVSFVHRLGALSCYPKQETTAAIGIKVAPYEKHNVVQSGKRKLKRLPADHTEAVKTPAMKQVDNLHPGQAPPWQQDKTKRKAAKHPTMTAPADFSSDDKENIPPWLKKAEQRPSMMDATKLAPPRPMLGKRSRDQYVVAQTLKRPRHTFQPCGV
ncbi:PIN domain-like protein [Dichotomocladium elegans]|nr:PIN domain-like protein [Dichotomocladium elegans]